MKTHTTIGRDAILAAEKYLDTSFHSSFLSLARDIAWTHHEKWDGTGYPQGLSGDMIPLAGRLMAIADVYDALIIAKGFINGLLPTKKLLHYQTGVRDQF